MLSCLTFSLCALLLRSGTRTDEYAEQLRKLNANFAMEFKTRLAKLEKVREETADWRQAKGGRENRAARTVAQRAWLLLRNASMQGTIKSSRMHVIP